MPLLNFASQARESAALLWIIAGVLILAVVRHMYLRAAWTLKAAHIPVLSHHRGVFASWKDTLDYLHNSAGVLQKGYDKYSKFGRFYRLRTPARWIIVVPPRLIEDIRRAPESELSVQISANDVQQAGSTIHPLVEQDKFHLRAVPTYLSPNLERKTVDIVEETRLAFDELIGSPQNWTALPAAHTARQVTTRAMSRMLVGAPLCRNQEFLDMAMSYPRDQFLGADKIRSWPDFLKPFATRLFTDIAQHQKVAKKHLLPLLTSRVANLKSRSDEDCQDEDAPDDAAQWLLEAAPPGRERDPERLVYRLLHLNSTAMHTSNFTLLNSLYDLALHVEIHAELREEIVRCLGDDGWTTRGLNKMWKLESFMLESQRLAPLASSQMTRAVVKDFTFSDGTTVPRGSWVLVPLAPMSLDDDLYPDAAKFDAFRWSRLRAAPGNDSRFQYVTTSPAHINFGYGRSACPGRFFICGVIKILLSEILLRYDIRLEHPDQLPPPTWVDRSRLPNQSAKILFRARA